jgi:hypothetical protein
MRARPAEMAPVDDRWSCRTVRRAGGESLRFLIHDHDTKFTAAFDTVFAAEGMEIILTPCQAPQANAVAERWVRSVRQECLDQIVILGQRHLHSVLTEYLDFYNCARPHQGIQQHTPCSTCRSHGGDHPSTRGIGRASQRLFSPGCLTPWRQRGQGFSTIQVF